MSRFSQCTICQQLTGQISDRNLSMEAKLSAIKIYRQHLHDQYVDRSACWALQDLSRDPLSGVLVILLDGIDQAKFSIPRDKGLRASAELMPGTNVRSLSICLMFYLVLASLSPIKVLVSVIRHSPHRLA